MNFCTRPPKGWLCTRHPSHSGPCAAWTTESLIQDALRYRFIRDDDQTFAVFMPRKHGHIAFNGEALDQQIDAACSSQETFAGQPGFPPESPEQERSMRRDRYPPRFEAETSPVPAKHCQNGGDVCLAGNRDGICCPDDSCDIDDGLRKDPTANR